MKEQDTNLKKIIFKIGIFLGLFLIACTIVSRHIYYLMLPQVECVSPQVGKTLKYEYRYKGIIAGNENIKVLNEENELAKENFAGVSYELYSANRVKFSVGADDIEKISGDNAEINIEYNIFNQENNKVERTKEAVDISSIKYNKDIGLYDIYAEFNEDNKFVADFSADIKISVESKPFWAVVPLDSIGTSYDGRNFVYIVEEKQSLFGIRTVVSVIYVYVEDKNNMYAGLDTPIGEEANIVYYATNKIEEGDEVRLLSNV